MKKKMKDAQRRMAEFAVNLTKGITPIQAVGLLVGCAIPILEHALGPGRAAEYFDEMAKELRENHAPMN
jgi:hypothetical protein